MSYLLCLLARAECLETGVGVRLEIINFNSINIDQCNLVTTKAVWLDWETNLIF